jgi:hypothetical protein
MDLPWAVRSAGQNPWSSSHARSAVFTMCCFSFRVRCAASRRRSVVDLGSRTVNGCLGSSSGSGSTTTGARWGGWAAAAGAGAGSAGGEAGTPGAGVAAPFGIPRRVASSGAGEAFAINRSLPSCGWPSRSTMRQFPLRIATMSPAPQRCGHPSSRWRNQPAKQSCSVRQSHAVIARWPPRQ